MFWTGLRGVAVLLVLWYHVWEISWLPAPLPWLQFVPETGFVGVHLFFLLERIRHRLSVRARRRDRPPATRLGALRVAPLHQDLSVVRALDRRRVRARLRADAAGRERVRAS